jgi:uncharacterized protein YjbI with pentapeptide repeats
MSTTKRLQIKHDEPLYMLLREGKMEEFNQRRAAGEACDLTFCDFRGLDLKNWDTAGLDLSGCYFRQADLRGVDFSNARLDGASINSAKVSGVLFPACLSADEITLSLMHGTRMRCSQA